MLNKTLCAIDFSMSSPGICIFQDNEYTFISFKKNDKKLNYPFDNTIPGLYCFTILENYNKNSEYHKTIDSINVAESIIEHIKSFIKYELYIALEGFSFGSSGNRLAEISGYQYILRHLIFKNFEIKDSNQFKIFAPTTVKKTAGSGRLQKEDMIQNFLNEMTDNSLTKHAFHKILNENTLLFKDGRKNQKWKKPTDDIIDAYWILRTLKNKLDENEL